jgi:acyl-CoA dehydrogenase
MYLASAVLKHFENQGRRAADIPLVEWSVRTLMYHAQEQLHGFLRNFPNRPVAFLLRCILFPRGRTYSAPSDELGKKIVSLITETGEARERLSEQAYKALAPNNPLGLLQEALALSEQLLPMEKKLKQARKEGLIRSEYLGHQIEEAAKAEIISSKEAAEMRDYHQKVLHLLSVDDFSPDEIGRKPGSNPDVPEMDHSVVPSLVMPAEETPAPKKTAKKKVTKKADSRKTGKKKDKQAG